MALENDKKRTVLLPDRPALTLQSRKTDIDQLRSAIEDTFSSDKRPRSDKTWFLRPPVK